MVKKGEKLEINEIMKQIEIEIFLQYGKQGKFAEKIGITQEAFSVLKTRIKSGKGTNYNRLESILNALGYELCIRKKESKKI